MAAADTLTLSALRLCPLYSRLRARLARKGETMAGGEGVRALSVRVLCLARAPQQKEGE